MVFCVFGFCQLVAPVLLLMGNMPMENRLNGTRPRGIRLNGTRPAGVRLNGTRSVGNNYAKRD